MKKKITKDVIVETALELMKDKNDLRTLNLREIARTLGCAHTNLYNYFPSYTDLLWETHATLQEMFMKILADKLRQTSAAELKLKYFFDAFVCLYLDNKGWFRLAWHEYIGEDRPERDIAVTQKSNSELTRYVSEIWKELHGEYPDEALARQSLHITHCYIVGEISNYISGRGLILNEDELKSHVSIEAMKIFQLLLNQG